MVAGAGKGEHSEQEYKWCWGLTNEHISKNTMYLKGTLKYSKERWSSLTKFEVWGIFLTIYVWKSFMGHR